MGPKLTLAPPRPFSYSSNGLFFPQPRELLWCGTNGEVQIASPMGTWHHRRLRGLPRLQRVNDHAAGSHHVRQAHAGGVGVHESRLRLLDQAPGHPGASGGQRHTVSKRNEVAGEPTPRPRVKVRDVRRSGHRAVLLNDRPPCNRWFVRLLRARRRALRILGD